MTPMARSDATSTRISCPTTGCPGRLQLDHQVDPVELRCPKCTFGLPVRDLLRPAVSGASAA